MILEFCAENFTLVPEAINQGAGRIELCDNLSQGGTTPSYGVIEQTVKYAHEHGATVMLMIRPRGGDFVYDDLELAIMLKDIEIGKSLNVDGFVFGCLKDGFIDESMAENLIEAMGSVEITFHMAFDQIDASLQFEAIDWLADHGVRRILTHGGPKSQKIADNVDRLLQLKHYAQNRLTILPGGGIRHDNLVSLHAQLQFQEYHGTKIVPVN